MRISNSDLINLPVYTKSGKHLGKISSFELEADSGKIENFHVKTGLIEGLWHEQLVINSSQVIEITEDKMIVEDNVEKERSLNPKLVGATE